MVDCYDSFEELRKSKPNSYAIESSDKSPMSDILFFSPHGGGIEPGTSEVCKHFESLSYSHYLFIGKGNECKKLHITSTKFNEPELVRMLQKHKHAISVHGMSDEMKDKLSADILLGGLNVKLIEIFTRKLREVNFTVTNNLESSDLRLAGKELNNVTNRCLSKQGMQIEISENLRRTFFDGDFKKKVGRKKTTEHFLKFCDALEKSVKDLQELR